MTIQNLFVAELTDILRVQIECAVCGAEVSYVPDAEMRFPGECPQCDKEWTDLRYPVKRQNRSMIEALMDILGLARSQHGQEAPFKLKLVFNNKLPE